MAKIMIVDDTLFMRTLIKTILKKAGHLIVAEAKDGDEAYKKYMMYKPDLVTMDITMHGTNGLDAVKRIIDHDKNARIIMVSAMSQKDMVIRAVKNGAKHFIIKPITVEKVVKVVNEVLGQNSDVSISKEDLQEVRKSIEEMKKTINDLEREEIFGKE